MDNIVVVFIQVKDEEVKAVIDMLRGVNQDRYVFMVLPSSAKFLTKEDLRRLLSMLPE